MPNVTVAAGMVGSGLVTLVANQVSTVTFTDNIGAVQVVGDGSADVWYTTNGVTPTVGGQESLRLPVGVVGMDVQPTSTGKGGVVKFISTAAVVVSVQRVQ